MKQFTPLQKRILLFGFIAQIITAWFSEGYNNADEHWQILEFANYKLGIFTAKSLPWEFHDQIRNAFIPTIVFAIRKALFAVNITDPFFTTFILRLIATIASYTCCVMMLNYSFQFLKTERARNAAVLLSFFLWFIPYLHCRFSSENIGGLLFFFGFLSIMPSAKNEERKSYFFLLAGFLFGLSFLSRFQMAFAVAGLFLYLLFIARTKRGNLALLVCSGLIALGVGFLIDYWYYGNWTFTAYNYYEANILRGKASEFGVMPFWFYLTSFTIDTVPPIGLFLFIGVLLSIYYLPKHPLSWVIVVFVVAHSLIPHKEVRFIFPLVYLLPLFTILWLEKVNWGNVLFKNVVFRILLYAGISINIILLLITSLKPANETVPFYRYIYRLAEKKEIVIYSTVQSPYMYDIIEDKFYASDNVRFVQVKSMEAITPDSISNPNKDYYFSDNHFVLPANSFTKGVSCTSATKTIPEWLSGFNYNNWLSRANIWSLYRLKRE